MLHNSCVASQETDSKAFSTPAAAIAEPHGFVMWFILFWRKICDSMPKKKCVCIPYGRIAVHVINVYKHVGYIHSNSM
jgi:hypothetical protein